MNMVKIKIKEKMSTIIVEKGELNNRSFRFVICTGEGRERECKAKKYVQSRDRTWDRLRVRQT